MKHKQLNVDFRYLGGNIACLSVSSVNGEVVENDINNEEAIIIFNSLVGEKKNCVTVKMLQQENEQLKKQLENKNNPQIFIDTEDMEERYGTDLYIEYLEKENKQKDEVIDDAINFVNRNSKQCLSNKENDVSIVGNFMWHTDKLLEILQKYKGDSK